jgi:hypothetical protein
MWQLPGVVPSLVEGDLVSSNTLISEAKQEMFSHDKLEN